MQPVVRRVVDAAERQRRAALVALGGVVVDDVQDHLQPGVVQARHHLLELGEYEGGDCGKPRIRGEEADRVVAPVVGEPLFQQMPVVDECVDWQELHRGDPERAEIIHHLLAAEAGEGALQLVRHRRMQLGEAAHMGFVDDGAVPRHVGPSFASPGVGGIDDAAFRHEAGAVAVVHAQVFLPRSDRVAEQRVVPAQRADERLGVRVEQQLVRIEAVAVLRIVGSIDPIPVDRAGPRVGQVAVPDLVGIFG